MIITPSERNELNAAVRTVKAAGVRIVYPHCIECPLFCGCYYQWGVVSETPFLIDTRCDRGPATVSFWSNK